jgi:hypothetical protein
MINPWKLAYCAEKGSSSVHIVGGRRGRAKPVCGPWWDAPTLFRRVEAERPTCRICLRVLGDSVGSPRIRLSTSLAHSVKPVVHVAHVNDFFVTVPRCGGAAVSTKRYDVTTDVVTCKACLGFTRGRK